MQNKGIYCSFRGAKVKKYSRVETKVAYIFKFIHKTLISLGKDFIRITLNLQWILTFK